MNDHRLSRPATGAASPRAVLLFAAVVLSLAGCSAGGPSGTDSLVAVEKAQAEAAAEVAEAQAAIDRQVEAADREKARTQAAADPAPQPPAVVADGGAARAAADQAAADAAAAERAAAEKAAAERAVAAKTAADRAAARKAAVAKTGARPPQRTPASTKAATPPRTSAKKVATAPVRPAKPVATRPPQVAAVPKPAVPTSRPAATEPGGQPQQALPSINDLVVVVAPGGTISTPGDESVDAGCLPQEFQPGEAVRLITEAGAVVHETVLPECQRVVSSAPGTGVAITSPGYSVTLPEIAWRSGDTWVLEIGTHRWPVTASTLSAYGWSIAVTAAAGVTAGPTTAT